MANLLSDGETLSRTFAVRFAEPLRLPTPGSAKYLRQRVQSLDGSSTDGPGVSNLLRRIAANAAYAGFR